MRAMAERVPVLDARFFVTAVLTQRESGGNLSEVLDNLASVMRDRFKLKRQIRVISAHGRMSAWVLPEYRRYWPAVALHRLTEADESALHRSAWVFASSSLR